jgi:arylsulfatase B
MSKKFLLILLSYFLLQSTNAQRNTLLIIADDLSSDYFGFYENRVDTVDVPNIRKLLAKGIRFKNLMSNPVCSSTRTTIFTGRYSFRTGVGGIVGGAGGSNSIDTAELTIPRLLKRYNTNIVKANIGKWHLSQPSPPINLQSPQIMGYDHYEGPFIGQLPSYTNWTKYTNGIASIITTYAPIENVNNAVTWLKAQNSTKPFFMWLAFNAPHEPLHLPPAGLHNYTSLSGTVNDVNARPKEYFKAMIQAMDHEMGRLFDSLQVLNKLDSTDIIFIGDNGNTPRTAQIMDTNKSKGTVYQYGVAVPLIIAGPSVVSPGRTSNALINTADLFATIVENFGYTNWRTQIAANKPVDAKSILPILKNTGTTIRPWSYTEIFRQTPDSTDGKAMRNLDYKLIRFDYGGEEFYNLANDPNENTNLLRRNLTTTEITNYNYLCGEMTTLIGTNVFCRAGVATSELDSLMSIKVAPNPFTNQIHISNSSENDIFQLVNSTGIVVFSGKNIQTQDFSHLPQGVYFLYIKDFGQQNTRSATNRCTKLTKIN